MNEYRIYPGISTRGARLADGEAVRFSREALDSVARQVGSGFVPMGTEHLTYLPPRGRLTRAEVVTDNAGESELVLYGTDLPVHAAANLSLDPAMDQGEEPAEILRDFTMGAEPRNYTPAAWQELLAYAPTEITEQVAWSELPPLVWMLYIAVSWGAIRFAAYSSRGWARRRQMASSRGSRGQGGPPGMPTEKLSSRSTSTSTTVALRSTVSCRLTRTPTLLPPTCGRHSRRQACWPSSPAPSPPDSNQPSCASVHSSGTLTGGVSAGGPPTKPCTSRPGSERTIRILSDSWDDRHCSRTVKAKASSISRTRVDSRQ
jgi:hypothetical protein